MNNKIPPLMWILILTSAFLAALGAYLKYAVLKPLELYQEESIIAVPFMLLSDDTAQYMLLSAREEPVPELEVTEPAETMASVQVIEPVSDETVPPATVPAPIEQEPVVIDESWFDDVLFIGDSGTKGMQNYGRLGKLHSFSTFQKNDTNSIQGFPCISKNIFDNFQHPSHSKKPTRGGSVFLI